MGFCTCVSAAWTQAPPSARVPAQGASCEHAATRSLDFPWEPRAPGATAALKRGNPEAFCTARLRRHVVWPCTHGKGRKTRGPSSAEQG